jgi:hypothetical protein
MKGRRCRQRGELFGLQFIADGGDDCDVLRTTIVV